MQNNLNKDGPLASKPGNRIYRVPRIRPLRINIPVIRQKRPIGISLLTIVYGFAGMIILGTVLLMLPVSSKSGEWTSFVNSLFTATSAVCVTGLTVVDTNNYWSYFGQGVILALIQFGGLGFMTSATVFLMAAGRRIGLRGRLLIGESLGVSHLGGVVRLTRNIILFTLIAEIAGALIFYSRFYFEYGSRLGIWKSVFQTVSSFNNAGFDIFGGFRSLSGFHSDYLVLLTTAGLIILGGISFIVLQNIFRSRGIIKSTVDTKLVLLITLILLSAGTLFTLASEFNNPDTLGPMSLPQKILNAFFQSVTSRTAGFSSFSTGTMALSTLFFTMILMFIGGASGSTAGGIKVNTLGILLSTILATIRGKEYPEAFNREIPIQQIFRALTLLVLALALIAVVFMILSFTENFLTIKILFETVSAFGTVGLSTGITPDLSTAGRVVLAFTMFIGRLGPLTLTFALVRAQHTQTHRYPPETIRIG
jgi:trk system potassium uptake protein TrkH